MIQEWLLQFISCVKLMKGNKFIVSELGLALMSDISVVLCRGTMYPEVWLWHREFNATLYAALPTENGRDYFSGSASFRYGRSTTNQVVIVKDCELTIFAAVFVNVYMYMTACVLQRIEAWWSVFRKWFSDWWLDFFKVRYEVYYTGLSQSMRFIYAPLYLCRH